MNKSVLYIGVDVGQEELWVAIDGRKPRSFSHNNQGIKKMMIWIKKYASNRPLHFCMEATGVYSYRLATMVSSFEKVSISIVNPAQISSFSKAQLRRTKTDKVDAQVILDFARSQKPPLWSPEPKSLRNLYHLVTMAETLRENIRQWMNRQHSSKYIHGLPAEIVRSQKSTIRSLTKQLEKIEKSIAELCHSDATLNKQVNLICTIPGIAEHSATRLLAYGRSALTERTKKELTAYAGLAPTHKLSGISVRGRSFISKQGNKNLRKTLFMPALVAIVHNPNIKIFYENLIKQGKSKKLAVLACMRKLLIIIHVILTKNTPFRPIIPLT